MWKYLARLSYNCSRNYRVWLDVKFAGLPKMVWILKTKHIRLEFIEQKYFLLSLILLLLFVRLIWSEQAMWNGRNHRPLFLLHTYTHSHTHSHIHTHTAHTHTHDNYSHFPFFPLSFSLSFHLYLFPYLLILGSSNSLIVLCSAILWPLILIMFFLVNFIFTFYGI